MKLTPEAFWSLHNHIWELVEPDYLGPYTKEELQEVAREDGILVLIEIMEADEE